MVLEHHGKDRSQVYITNIVACREAGGGTPPKKAIQCCAPRAKLEIRKRQPRTILALGNTAAQSILQSRTGITGLRVGPPKSSPEYPDVAIIPTFHPAACLRQSDNFPHLVKDFGKINWTDNSTWSPPAYRVFDDPQEAYEALQQLIAHEQEEMVIDIEVGIEKDTDFNHPDQYEMLCVGIGYAKGKVAVIGEEAFKDQKVQKLFGQLLRLKKWVAHNGKFDLAGVRPYTRGKPVLAFDTMLAHYVLDERAGIHGLKYLAVERLGAPQYDDEVKRYVGPRDSYAVVPRDILYRYNAYDVACTWDLWEILSKELDEAELRHVHDFLCDASQMLMDVERDGLTVDIPYLDHQTDNYLTELEGLEEALSPWVKNPRSPKQVKEALAELKCPVESTNEETLKKILENRKWGEETHQFVGTLLEHRKEQKLYGTYIKGIRKRLYRGRVHPTFLLHGTTSGRLACRNPNMQNIPRESSIRDQFVPSPGHIFIQADYAQAELRVVAYLARDEYLRSVFNEGRDLHGEVAERFFGPGWTKEQRVRAKAVVFGLTYGREAYSLAQEFKIPESEAKGYLDEFFQVIPDTVRWRKQIEETVLHKQEDLVTPFGRRRRFWLITRDNQKDVLKEAYSFLPQSTASDICLSAAIRLNRMGMSIRNIVHDSILVECDPRDSDEVASTMTEVMTAVATEKFGDYVRFEADVNIGNSWGKV